jgi:peptidylamidoglycolate lyase
MRRNTIFWLMPLLVVAACMIRPTAVAVAYQVKPVTANYEVVRHWPVIPDGAFLGQVAGVDVDSHNHVFIFQRGSDRNSLTKPPAPMERVKEPAVLVFDGDTGRLINQWGANEFVRPHGLTIDYEDNVWLTDNSLHQVFKYSNDGRLLLTLGKAGEPGSDDSHFNAPTDVAVLRDGTFYVSDGYGNNRVVEFSRDAKVLKIWGGEQRGDGPGQFDLPHCIDADDQGHIYVADRTNKRIQIFDRDGKFLSEWKNLGWGVPYAIKIKGGQRFIADGGDLPGRVNRSSVFLVDENGHIQSSFGRWGRYDGEFDVAHDIAVGNDGSVYVVDVLGQRVQKFRRTKP